MAMLRHFERLAVPHTPREFVGEIDRSICRAERVLKGFTKKRKHEAGARAAVSQLDDQDQSPMADTDQQHFLKKLGEKLSSTKHLSPAKPEVTRPAEELCGSQRALANALKMPESVPFCIDMSWKAFSSFLHLIKGLVNRNENGDNPTASRPIDMQMADSPEILNIKCTTQYKDVTDNIGPESSPCREPSPRGYSETEMFDKTLPQKQRNAPADGVAVASKPVIMEVLRCTLKLLKVNLFNLARAAAVRRSYRSRGSDDFNNLPGVQICGTNNEGTQETRTGQDAGGAPIHEQSKSKEKKDDTIENKGVLIGHSDGEPASRSGLRDNASADIFNENESPNTQGAVLKSLGQKREQLEYGRVEIMSSVIKDLHGILREILERSISEEHPEAIKAARAVQASVTLVESIS